MNRNHTRSKIQEIVHQSIMGIKGLDDIKDGNELFHDLRLDVVDLVELSMTLEEVYPIAVEDDEVVIWETVKDVVDYVERRLVSGNVSDILLPQR